MSLKTNLDIQMIKTIRKNVLSELDLDRVNALSEDRSLLLKEISIIVKKFTLANKIYFTQKDLNFISELIVDEIMGLGPLRVLMEDESISDILVNGPYNIFIERGGKLEKSEQSFLDNTQLTDIAKRLVSKMGRRVDEAQPLVDARLQDGSRINVVINPIALDGTSISIRKFNKKSMKLEEIAKNGSMSQKMAKFLSIAAYCKCNIIISGGTGSGKTTLLNALSQHIGDDERIITLEDAAELKLMQPHLVRLETRMAGVEQSGQINMRELVINALRMRPDRIIVGECRGGEAFEMLQAMNTGHDGSMTTLHANSPFDALSRLENLVLMSGFDLPLSAIRYNIASAVDLIIQITRLNDGSRKIVDISEIGSIDESGKVKIHPIFTFQAQSMRDEQNKIIGTYQFHGLREESILNHNAILFNVKTHLDHILNKQGE